MQFEIALCLTSTSLDISPLIFQRRHRKCSIVKEEECDEDHHDSESSLNRRGSRSEGRINLSVQEVLSAEMSGKLKLEKNFRRPEGAKTKLFDGISNVKLIGKNENEKFLGHAGMGARKLPGNYQKQPMLTKKLVDDGDDVASDLRNDLIASSAYCDNSTTGRKKKATTNSSTDDEEEPDEKKKPSFKPSFGLNNKFAKQRRDSHDDSSDSQEPTGTSNRILINIAKCSGSTNTKQTSNDDQSGKKTKSDGVNELAESKAEETVDCLKVQDHDIAESANHSSKLNFISRSSNAKSNKNSSNGKVKKNSSRFLGFLRETSETRDYNYKSNRKSFSDAEFLKIRNEKSDKELCPTENRKLVGRYLEVCIE